MLASINGNILIIIAQTGVPSVEVEPMYLSPHSHLAVLLANANSVREAT